MMYPVLNNMNNWLSNEFDNMFDDSWMPRMNVTAPAINVKENEKEYDIELAALSLFPLFAECNNALWSCRHIQKRAWRGRCSRLPACLSGSC